MKQTFVDNELPSKKSKQSIQWLKFIAILLVTLSVFFRFTNLEQKFYWHDEVINSFGVAGYTVTEAVGELSQQQEINFGQLQKYQYPNANKNLLSPISVLARNEAQNPPLYYLVSWIWFKIFGNSITVARSLSAIISLLIFPAIYWLCQELFKSSTVAWTAVILTAVSPFYLLYAQEARPYSLWSVTILASSFFFLRAIRTERKYDWLLYSISLIGSYYTFPFSLFVAIGHGVYFFGTVQFKNHKNLAQYLTASLLSIVAFSPWLLFIKINSHKISDWRSVDVSVLSLIKSWIGNLSRLFLDLNLDSTAPAIYIIPSSLILLLLTIYSIYYLCRKTPPSIWLFVITLISVTAIALVLPDLVSGGQRSRVARYLTPCYLGINLAVAYYVGREILSKKLWRKLLSISLLISLIISGILSCFVSLQANNWWHKSWSKLSSYEDLTTIAQVVNQSPQSLVIAPQVNQLNEDVFFELLSLTYLINPNVKLQFGLNPEAITSEYSIFIYDPLEKSSQELSPNQFMPITDNFWQKK
ncbi:MAG: hypothetical protein Tsb0014_09510 [Pleurocapsa sp.]